METNNNKEEAWGVKYIHTGKQNLYIIYPTAKSIMSYNTREEAQAVADNMNNKNKKK